MDGKVASSNPSRRDRAEHHMGDGTTLTRTDTARRAPAEVQVEAGTRELRCDVSYETGLVIATIAGELDLESAPGLERRLGALLMLPLEAMTIDLAGVSFMDSAGLSALVRVHRMANDLRMHLRIEQPSDRVAWMLDLTRLGATVVSDPPR